MTMQLMNGKIIQKPLTFLVALKLLHFGAFLHNAFVFSTLHYTLH